MQEALVFQFDLAVPVNIKTGNRELTQDQKDFNNNAV